MLHFEGDRGVRFCDGLTRRDFLRAGALGAGAAGLTLADLARAGSARPDASCIVLFLVGGPSHLDTFDLKPDAPAEVRGPFRPVRTAAPGLDLCEHLPRLAERARLFSLVRSLHHDAAPIHETGHQLMQTGRLARGGVEHPSYGAVLSHLAGPRRPDVPASVVLPAAIGNTGVSVDHGQGAGYLDAAHAPLLLRGDPSRGPLLPLVDAAQRGLGDGGADRAALFTPAAKRAYDLTREADAVRDRYGRSSFGQGCLLARRLVEAGTRLVTVNMFDSVFNEVTWDCHADSACLATTLDDYRATLCPLFDRAAAALLDDLHERGLLDSTLVLAVGEFGRTPYLNPRGGRDHWPGCWSALLAGGGVQGGRIVGASDAIGAEPKERPVTPGDLAATVYHALGVGADARLPGPDGRAVPLADGAPVAELF